MEKCSFIIPFQLDSKTNVSSGDDLSKERGGRQIAVLGITDSLNARSRGEKEAKLVLVEMPTQRSELDSESAVARGMANASTENVEPTQLSEAVSLNDYILRAAAENVVIHPGLVKMKGNIDQSTFRVKTKDEIMELEEAMQSDRNSEHEKGQQQTKALATSKPAPAIKWGDTKSVLFETTSQLTFDDDEIIDEPDLYH
ncbi:unnamed protein product [Cylicocyclus nassatus]|uniref:Uncharacterized protein n=1 Tax=Cylicocyclus nassatus TaxID=53992 RepID=A0AA36M650_CYLNA|nr:unnamed protein product [Cylicocyclus nassatus]